MTAFMQFIVLMALTLGATCINAAPGPGQVNTNLKDANTNAPQGVTDLGEASITPREPQGRETKPIFGYEVETHGWRKRDQKRELGGNSNPWPSSEANFPESDSDTAPSDKEKRQIPCSVPSQWGGSPRHAPPGRENCPKGRFEANGDGPDVPKVAREFTA